MSKSISPMYSSSNCIVLSVTYRSFVHFDFIFVYDIVGQLSQHHYWRDCLFSLYIHASFVIHYVLIGMWAFFLSFYHISFVYIFIFVPVKFCLDYFSLKYSLKSQSLIPQLCISFARLLWIFEVFFVSISQFSSVQSLCHVWHFKTP